MKHFLKTALLLVLLFTVQIAVQAQSPIVDYTFNTVQANNLVYKIMLQPDGKILVGGAFTNYGGTGRNNLVRLNSDGTIDTTFNPNGGGPANAVYDMALMPDGRMVIVGNFVNYNSTMCSFVVRINADGTVDNTFSVQANVINGAIRAVEIQSDEKVVIAGDFFTCFSHSQPHITRLKYDGDLDTSFHVGTGFNNPVYDLLLLPDQRILCGGQFVMYQGQPSLGIALLLPDAMQDTSFHTSTAFTNLGTAIVHSLSRQSDGKIIAGGAFCYHNAQQITGITRLNMDGTRDLSFTPPLYPYAIVKATAIQADNKILAGGEFTTSMYNVNITGTNKILRMHPNGTIDTSFHAGTAFQNANDFLNDLEVQPDTKILAGGNFTFFDSETMYHHLIRLYESVPLSIAEYDEQKINLYPNPSSGEFAIVNPFSGNSTIDIRIFNAQGQIVYSRNMNAVDQKTILLNPELPAGIYFIRLQNEEKVLEQKLIISN